MRDHGIKDPDSLPDSFPHRFDDLPRVVGSPVHHGHQDTRDQYKKDIDPRALAHVNQELEASAAASARLDQRMQDIRDEIKRITGK